ncbi:hypothetical protein NECAME_13117 [Necator americanus]|uniref:Uncharacterized protein n=1 Tax=Necator americanus TaxID=51031 RepID=W2SZ24_NECAM|nr:hypothetical protein NECAME_13117 [Necator americanus]ETN74211.1 hypothetical protein NECAME_13117 [Necator americanus]
MVYIDGREVRRITDEEERKVDEILGPWSRRRRMKRRGTREISKEKKQIDYQFLIKKARIEANRLRPGYSPLRDISIFLDRFLNVNPTVTKRFAPWFQHSPLVSGSEPGLSYGPSSFVSPKHLERPIVPKPIKPGGYGVKRRPASRWEAKVISPPECILFKIDHFARYPQKLSENNAPVNKTETIIVPNGKNSYPSTATSTPSSEVITTTKQTLLQFLAKSLADPELVRTLKEIEKAHLGHAPLQSYSKKEGTPVPNEPDFLPDPVAKWFTRTTEEPNDVEEHLSFLPDEICTAHMKKSSIKRLTHI